MTHSISLPPIRTAPPQVAPPQVSSASGAPLLSMADVEAASSADPASAAWFVSAMDGGLSPEEAMAACRHRLQSLDGQIREITREMSRRNRLQDVLGEISRLAGQTTGGGDSVRLRPEAEAAICQLQDELEACGPDGQQAWQRICATINEARDGDGIGADEIRTLTEAVSHAMADVNSGTEMLQLRLQTLMNQRQQAVQLTTNIMGSLNQSAMAVLQNIGR